MANERIHRAPGLTNEERARQKAVREKFQRERPTMQQLVESGDADPPIPLGVYVELRLALLALKKAREAAGLSLTDVAERSGMDKAALSRLENGVNENPTVETLMRYAQAIGKKLTMTVSDAEPAPAGM